MGGVAKILSQMIKGVLRKGVCDKGYTAKVTAEQFGPAGDDSAPMAGDTVAIMEIGENGRSIIVGSIDVVNVPKAAAGEKRFYSRGALSVPMAEIWLKKDGTVVISNLAGKVELSATGGLKASNNLGAIDLQSTGGVTVSNTLGKIALSPVGIITLNNLVNIDLLGNIVTTGSIHSLNYP